MQIIILRFYDKFKFEKQKQKNKRNKMLKNVVICFFSLHFNQMQFIENLI